MNKFKKFFAGVSFALISGMIITGCFNNVIWEANLNNDLFGVYGTVEQVDDSLVLKRAQDQNYACSTYFGEEDKNFDWENGGLTVDLKVNIDTTKYGENDYSVWSLALNETDGKYITENSVFFIGTENGVKFIYKNVGVETDYNALKNEESAASLNSGDYTIRYDYNINNENEITLTINLLDSSNREIYRSIENEVVVIDHEGYTPNTPLNQDNVGGLRYLWLARTSVDGVVKGLKISK